MTIAKLNQSMIKTLEDEISSYKLESMKQRKSLYSLEKLREKYGAEASDANAKFAAALEEARRPPPPDPPRSPPPSPPPASPDARPAPHPTTLARWSRRR